MVTLVIPKDRILLISELTKLSVTPSSHLSFQLPVASTQIVHSHIYSFNKYYVLGFILGSGDKMGNTKSFLPLWYLYPVYK